MDIEKFCGLQFKGLTFEAVLFLKHWEFSLPLNTVGGGGGVFFTILKDLNTSVLKVKF